MSLQYPCIYYDNGKCQKFTDDKFDSWCVRGETCQYQTPSNGDIIRSMSDEELIDFFRYRGCPPDRLTGKCVKVGVCSDCWGEWLKQPAKEE